MAKLYIITGPAGVGKSTISKHLASKKDKSALIEGDLIYHEVVGGYKRAWESGNHLHVFWQVVLQTIKIYLENDYDVIFNYIISPYDLLMLKQELKEYETKFILLLTDAKTLLERDKTRPLDCQMKNRCLVLLESFKNKDYNNKNIIDTTNLTIEETINIIESKKDFII